MRTRESLLPATAVTRINVARSGLENSFYTAWVISGSLTVVTRTSAPGSEADEIGDKADLAFEMSGPGQNQKAPRSQNLTQGMQVRA